MTTETIPATEVIELRELRIGNILSYEGKPVHVTAISLDIDDEYEDSIYFCNIGENVNEKGGWNRAICDKLKRIPLTPELLEKAGFEKDDTYIGKPHYFHPGTMLFELATKYPSGRFRAIRKVGNFDGVIIGERIDYLHQLQNLYFAMTGEELEIKL